MEERKTALYIHGWNGSPSGSTGTTVRNFFEARGFCVISPKFDLADYEKTSAEIRALIEKENVGIVVGHSFGAFYAFSLQSENFATILINPCLHPAAEIPKLGGVPPGFAEEFECVEKKCFAHVPSFIKLCTFSIFGENDELFSCKDEFAQKYKCTVPADYPNDSNEIANFTTVNGTHHLETDALIEGLKRSMEYHNAFSKIAQYIPVW